MWLLDRNPLLQKSLEEVGFRKIRDITIYRNAEVYGLEETYSLNGINVDIFIIQKLILIRPTIMILYLFLE